MKKKIIITGGDGRFAKVLKVKNKKLNIFYPNKKELNILNVNSIRKYINKIKPKYLIHAAALSRPMNIHNKKINQKGYILSSLILTIFQNAFDEGVLFVYNLYIDN